MRGLIWLFLLFPALSDAQAFKVLFLGNSYTAVNSLPQMLANLAASNGDSLIYDEYTPGGYSLQAHASDPAALAKINQENWDFVVLQDQSQRPSLSPAYVQANVYPYAVQLDQLIRLNDSCTETMFYMTWGRKYGDQENCPYYPPVCTFEGMQQRLSESYIKMSDTVSGLVAPVGVAWKNLRTADSTIELYDSDNSHPSLAGTYLTACTFYAAIWRKSPAGLGYTASIPSQTAALLQNIAASTVLDSLSEWNIGLYDVKAAFSDSISNLQVSFSNQSVNAGTWNWSFGDGAHSSLQNPVHSYAAPGQYIVQLSASNGCKINVSSDTLNLVYQSFPEIAVNENEIKIYPNPLMGGQYLNIESDRAITAISLNDLAGRKVYNVTNCYHSTIKIILPGHIHKGIYILGILLENGYLHHIKLGVN